MLALAHTGAKSCTRFPHTDTCFRILHVQNPGSQISNSDHHLGESTEGMVTHCVFNVQQSCQALLSDPPTLITKCESMWLGVSQADLGVPGRMRCRGRAGVSRGRPCRLR